MLKEYPISKSFIIILLIIYSLTACKKEKIYSPVPFLTGRTWIADTITIDLPFTYSQLSNADQQSYRASMGWFKLAKLTLNDNGTVTPGGDYELGYMKWRLVHNNKDIEMTLFNGNKQILRNWVADANHFSYTTVITLNSSTTFDGTVIFE